MSSKVLLIVMEFGMITLISFPKVFLDCFDNLFFTSGSLIDKDVLFGVQRRVSEEMNITLCHPFTTNEVKASLFLMYPTKALGCDGIPTLMF